MNLEEFEATVEALTMLWLWASACFGAYFVPTIVAWQKKQRAPVLVLNLFLGWTLLGWVAALVMAVWPAPPNAIVAAQANQPSSDDALQDASGRWII